MGRIASSSKKKSSKRKSSKLSSEARRRKKSRINKSKKLRRRDDSNSSNSDDDSMSSVSVSSSSSEDNYLSSSEDEYKSRKGRSRARSDAKNRKKKSRRRSSSPERSKDSACAKKRKRSKKDANSRSRKKSRKTKRRRDVSISSASSDSGSRSTCQGGNSRSIEESEPERHRGRSRESKRNKRDPYKARNKTRNSRSRSPSCSSYSRYSHHSRSVSPGSEKIAPENKSRRLRSVISVVEQRHENDHFKSEKDPYKEEIVYDRDDYPSSRSNDSNDGVSRRESAYVSHVASDKGRQGQSVTGEEVYLSKLGTKDPIEDGMGCSGQHAVAGSYRLKTTIPENENETEISGKVAGSGDNDLELILRQKALENLRRFRGERQMDSKTTSGQENKKDTSTDQLSAKTVKDFHEKSLKLDASNEHFPATDIEKGSNPTLKRNLTRHAEVKGNILGEVQTGKDPEVGKQNDIHQPLSGSSEKEKNSTAYTVNEEPGSGISALRQGSLFICSAVRQAKKAQAPSESNLLATKIPVSETALTPSPSLTPSGNNNQATGIEAVNISSSTGKEPTISYAESTSVEHSSTEQQDEPKDGSEFEQKTMSVMRGGEMVQVNYKVYIPKKAPALARRHLRR